MKEECCTLRCVTIKKNVLCFITLALAGVLSVNFVAHTGEQLVLLAKRKYL